MDHLFGILNLGHAQRRRLRRVLEFVRNSVFGAWNFHDFHCAANFFICEIAAHEKTSFLQGIMALLVNIGSASRS